MHLKYWSPLLIAFLIISCTQEKLKETTEKETLHPIITKIVEAHGGLEKWKDQHTLAFDLGNQLHTIDLKSREVKITSPNFSMGNDNGTVWLKDENGSFNGSPSFYHSLMFYFYAMPFVFTDEGIMYKEMPEKNINETTYKAIKMSFEEGVGDSPKDEYIIYYHPETYKMEWLAYTVTFQSQEKSDDFNLIHYKNWDTFNGLLMPTELQWYQYKNGEIGGPRGGSRTFANTKVMEKDMEDDFYAMPEGAIIDSAGAN